MTSRHITAAEVRHQQKSLGKRERERERENVCERGVLGKFSKMRFDSATSSFLALLLIKSYKKLKKAKF